MTASRTVRRALRSTSALGVVAVMASGCGPGSRTAQDHPGVLSVGAPRVSAAPASRAGSDLATFGGRIFLADSSISASSNSAISPYSIFTALSMTRAGARGATGAELDRALGGSAKTQAADVTAVDAAVKSAVTSANRHRDKKAAPMVVQPSNAVWTDSSLRVHKSYLKSLASGYGAAVHTTDFRNDPVGSRRRINGWVKDRTNQLIPKLLSPRAVTRQTRVELVNALYLKARWANQMTVVKGHMTFTTAGGAARQPTYMKDQGSMAIGHGNDWRSITIPYAGGGLAMTIILPNAGRYQRVRQHLPWVIGSATRSGSRVPVDLTMPKFSVATHTGLVPALRKLGVTKLFGNADLSGIAGKPGDLTVGSVVHQSVVKVDKNGTQAAAATAVGITSAGVRAALVQFTVNRAFFFVIHDRKTGAPLFLGQVADPTL